MCSGKDGEGALGAAEFMCRLLLSIVPHGRNAYSYPGGNMRGASVCRWCYARVDVDVSVSVHALLGV